MNSIPDLQNQPSQILQLAAQRQCYAEAKSTLAWQMFLTIGLGVGFSLSAIWAKGKGIEQWVEKGTAFLSMLIALVDVLVMEPHQKKLAQQAAKIQEAFDCDVLGLPWHELKVGDRPEIELINQKAEKHRRVDPQFTELKDWYSPNVAQVPLAIARLLCQRTNIWWDAGLRRRYAWWLSFGLPSILVLLVGFGLYRGVLLSGFVFSMLIPMLPGFLWGIREFKKQRETASTLDRLHAVARKLWEKAIRSELTEEQLTQSSRDLQNEIYDHRRSAPYIFDWIYKRLKKNDEVQMNTTSKDLAQEYLNKQNPQSSYAQLDPVKDDDTAVRKQIQKELRLKTHIGDQNEQ